MSVKVSNNLDSQQFKILDRNFESNKKEENISLFIFRRDFRLYDNTALYRCLKESKKVYPIFIFTPEQVSDKNDFKSSNAIQFMIESLIDLSRHQELPNLTLLYGDYISIIKKIVSNNSKITSIYTNTDYTPYAIERDYKISKLCESLNLDFYCYHDITLIAPGNITNQSGTIYQKFTPFYNTGLNIKIDKVYSKPSKRQLLKTERLSRHQELNKYIINFQEAQKFYNENSKIHVHGGRNLATKILNSISKFKNYEDTHSMLPLETTHLSAYLKFGCLSIREAYFKLVEKFNKKDPIVRQLFWRDFYYHLGYHFVKRFGKSLKPNYDKIKWSLSKSKFESWKKGETGFPIVDACMKQINTTGYMHNRGRLIVASFLVKNLGIDWRFGEKYFAQSLVDYDVLVNNGNWQWVSGSGADSQPYFRIFNPALQSEKFDPECQYIKKWLPNLSEIPKKHLHHWSDNYSNYDLKQTKYFKPIINYKESKEKVLDMYKKAFD
jgi:deoxyribodipyrimidine photo-lyase